MIRVDVGPRLSRSARKLGDQIIAEVEAKLALVSRHFGEPHRHSGLGLRKLGRRSLRGPSQSRVAHRVHQRTGPADGLRPDGSPSSRAVVEGEERRLRHRAAAHRASATKPQHASTASLAARLERARNWVNPRILRFLHYLREACRVLACRPGSGFRGPYRQSEMSQAEAHYL